MSDGVCQVLTYSGLQKLFVLVYLYAITVNFPYCLGSLRLIEALGNLAPAGIEYKIIMIAPYNILFICMCLDQIHTP
jgi:hypothetical protein